MINSRKVQLFIIVSLTTLVYLNSLWGNFVWDDQFFIQDWTAIRDIKNLPSMLQGVLPPRFSGAYRPILSLSYLLSYQLYGQNALGYHLQAFLAHLVCTILVYLISVRVIGKVGKVRDWAPFATAILFGVHPIHTEAVSYIAASFNTIGVMFMLAAFWLYLRMVRKKTKNLTSYILLLTSYFLAVLAFFTYEFTLVLPLLVLWYELTLGKLGLPATQAAKALQAGKLGKLGRIVPYFLSVGIYLVLRMQHIHTVGRGGYLLGSFYLTMLAMSKVFVRYLQLLVVPIHQSINHMLPGGILAGVYLDPKVEAIQKQSFWDPWVWLGILGLLGMLGAIWITRKKAPLITFSLGWYLISLLPASNIIPVQELMAERYLYIPSFGFILFMVLIVEKIVGEVRKVGVVVTVAILIFYSYLTFTRNFVWKDNFSLWENTSEESPISEIALFNLGNAYMKKGDIDNAIKSYKQATNNNPRSQVVYINLGNAYFREKRYEEALSSYKKAVEILPYTPANHNNLASVYVVLGQNALAARHYVIAILLDPNHQTAKNNLQILVSQQKGIDVQKIMSTINLEDRKSLVE